LLAVGINIDPYKSSILGNPPCEGTLLNIPFNVTPFFIYIFPLNKYLPVGTNTIAPPNYAA